MNIEYCESIACPGYFCALVNNVLVAFWSTGRWIDRGVYRPMRTQIYRKTEWNGPPFDLSLLASKNQLDIVIKTGREAVGDYDY